MIGKYLIAERFHRDWPSPRIPLKRSGNVRKLLANCCEATRLNPAFTLNQRSGERSSAGSVMLWMSPLKITLPQLSGAPLCFEMTALSCQPPMT